MKKSLLSLILVPLLLSFSLLPGEAAALKPERGPEVVKVGLVIPLSGAADWMGERILRGVKHALGMRLGELEVDVRLSIEDSGSDPARAASAVKKLGEDRQVIAIIGPALSESAVEAAPSVTLMRLPTISPTAVAQGVPGLSPYLFRNSMTVKSIVDQLVDYATRKMGILTYSVLYPLNSRGVRMQDEFAKRVEEAGGKIVYSFSYPPEDTDFGEIMKKMGGTDDDESPHDQSRVEQLDDYALQAEYQALFLPGNATSAGLIAPALQYYNITGVQLLGTNRWGTEELLSRGDGYVEGAVFVDGFFADSPWPQVADFVKSYRRAFGEIPDVISAQSYDAASIILDSIQSGVRRREEMRRALLRIRDYPGVSGYTTFLPSGESKKELFILTVEEGKIVQIN